MMQNVLNFLLSIYVLLGIILLITKVSEAYLFSYKGKHGWAAFVPVYSEITKLKIIGLNPLLVLLYFIPGVGGIFSIFVNVKFILEYDKSVVLVVLTILFPYIFYPVLVKKVSKEKQLTVFSTVLLIISVLLIMVAVIPFEAYFNKFTLFTDFNTKLAEFKLFGYNLFANLIAAPAASDSLGQQSGILPALGAWTLLDVSTFIFIITIVLVILSRKGFDEQIKTLAAGTKKILPIAVTSILVLVPLVLLVNSGVAITIINRIVSLTKGFNLAVTTLAGLVGSVLVSSFKYFTYFVGQVILIGGAKKEYYSVIGFIMQSIYHFTMIFAPTSVLLIIGLYYLNIPYNKWLKYIWKVLLVLLAIVLILSIIIFKLV